MTEYEHNRTNELDSMGLPSDYDTLNAEAQKQARIASLTSWFDLNKPWVVCSDVEKYLKAHKLFVEFYLKAWPDNQRTYCWRDPTHKYRMLRAFMGPAQKSGQPTKAVLHAPRRSAKTITLIIERYTFIACVRPRTVMLLSEINQDLTADKMRDIRTQIETNELIHRDFGGPGELIPSSRYDRHQWNTEALELLNGSVIAGVSVMSSHRGRGPDIGTIDDAEDEKKLQETNFKRNFFRWLFNSYMFMFGRGGCVGMIGTTCDVDSCLDMALQGRSEGDPDNRDRRFDDWYKERIPLIEEHSDGTRTSNFEDRMSVSEFDEMVESGGYAEAMGELQGKPVKSGYMVFTRDDMRHGYMRCIGKEGEDDYFLDLESGLQMPWGDFLMQLQVFGGVDFANSMATWADPGAIIVVGARSGPVFYVLDAWIKKAEGPKIVHTAYEMAERWKIRKIAWEAIGLGSVLTPMAVGIYHKYVQSGRAAPQPIKIKSHDRTKAARIISTLRDPLEERILRFPYFGNVTDSDGNTHVSAKNPASPVFKELKRQIDQFTVDGSTGHDDGIDALSMCMRIARKSRGVAETEEKDDHEVELEKWRKFGVHLDHTNTPSRYWTRDMYDKWLRSRFDSEPLMAGAVPYE